MTASVVRFLTRRWRLIGVSVAVVVLLMLALPYALSAYHLQAGGRALERALGQHEALNWWYVGPREARDRQALEAAIAHLEKATRAPYAQRLLGQAYVAQGNELRGVRALEQFVERRPKHYLAQLELAAAYVYADERLRELEYLDLLDRLDGASVSAPDLAGGTRYSAEQWQSEYAYPTTYSLPPEYGERPTLFLHAGSQVTWTVALSQPSVLRFGMGQAPESLAWGGDGATYEVFVDGERVFLEHLPLEQAREGWHEREVDLASFVGQTVQLSLATTPGPTGDVTGDWAGWGEPRLEDVEAFAYREVVKRQPWRAKWSEMGITAEAFVRAGESARETHDDSKAWAWFDWTTRIWGQAYDEFADLSRDQLLILDSFVSTRAWHPCSWCGTVRGSVRTDKGVLHLSYRNRPERRDGFSYLTLPDRPVAQFSELVLRLKGTPSTLLTIELRVDDVRTRPISYQPLSPAWDTLEIPIEGAVLNEILVGIGEQEDRSNVGQYDLWVDWIGLR
jgi:tetratricopeptide (TPR) repeat protein